jgi:hypothetical protein
VLCKVRSEDRIRIPASLLPYSYAILPLRNQAGFLGRVPEVPFSQLRIHWNIEVRALETVVSPIHFRTWLETRKPKEKLGVGIWGFLKIT